LIISDYKYWMFIALGFLSRLFRASKLILTFVGSKTKYNIFYKNRPGYVQASANTELINLPRGITQAWIAGV